MFKRTFKIRPQANRASAEQRTRSATVNTITSNTHSHRCLCSARKGKCLLALNQQPNHNLNNMAE